MGDSGLHYHHGDSSADRNLVVQPGRLGVGWSNDRDVDHLFSFFFRALYSGELLEKVIHLFKSRRRGYVTALSVSVRIIFPWTP